jgi:ribosomal protein L11 methyltransferase
MSEDAYWTLDAELAPEAEELWGLFCFENGAAGAEWLEESPTRLLVRYSFGALADPDASRWLDAFRGAYPGRPVPRRLTLTRRPVEPWDTRWRAHFAPLAVGRRLLICPPWELPQAPPEAAAAPRLRIVIDPGQGFGTGRHASTALALEALEAHLSAGPAPPDVLDVGTGSGVLALAACVLGVARAWALDVDGRCLPEVRRNFALTGIATPPRLAQGGPECLAGAFPLVCANITAPALLALAPHLARLTLPGGHLILSGLLTGQGPEVTARYRSLGFTPAATREREGWLSVVYHRSLHPLGQAHGNAQL